MSGALRQLGNNDNTVSPYLKAWIKQTKKGMSTLVTGLIAEGTSKEIVSNWQSPFEGESLGGHFQKIGGLIKVLTGTDFTTQPSLASEQVWQGNQPHAFTLALTFYALTNPAIEVTGAIDALEQMMLPELNLTGIGYEDGMFGKDPGVVTVCIAGKQIKTDCVLTNLSVPLDRQRTKEGHLIRADVNLMIESKQMLNYSVL